MIWKLDSKGNLQYVSQQQVFPSQCGPVNAYRIGSEIFLETSDMLFQKGLFRDKFENEVLPRIRKAFNIEQQAKDVLKKAIEKHTG